MTCWYYPDQADDPSLASDPTPLDKSTLQKGDWVWVNCINSETFDPVALYRTQIGADGLPIADPAEVAQAALALVKVPTPVPQSWPPLDHQVVGVRTWLHIDAFAPQSATATAGEVQATVTITPTQVVWHLGTDGQRDATATCTGAGQVWSDGQPDDATDCSYLFQHYSEGRTMTGSVEVSYHATWTSNVGVGGDLGAVTAQADLATRVWEIQAQIN